MLTRREIIDRLLEYHEETRPETISEAAQLRAWSEGYADPCGCTLCQLMDELQAEEIAQRPTLDGNELVARAWANFDEWHGDVCHDMPDHLTAEWEEMSIPMQIYLYSRENSAADAGLDCGARVTG